MVVFLLPLRSITPFDSQNGGFPAALTKHNPFDSQNGGFPAALTKHDPVGLPKWWFSCCPYLAMQTDQAIVSTLSGSNQWGSVRDAAMKTHRMGASDSELCRPSIPQIPPFSGNELSLGPPVKRFQ